MNIVELSTHTDKRSMRHSWNTWVMQRWVALSMRVMLGWGWGQGWGGGGVEVGWGSSGVEGAVGSEVGVRELARARIGYGRHWVGSKLENLG